MIIGTKFSTSVTSFLSGFIVLSAFCGTYCRASDVIHLEYVAQAPGQQPDTAKKSNNSNIKEWREGDQVERAKQELDRTRDPFTKTVPVERLILAKKIKDQLLARPNNNLKGRNRALINTIQWNERGPTNVGGRTRALLFDLNDKVNGYKKVFAGGVGGGLWYTNDITATPVLWNKIDDFLDNIAITCITQNPNNPLEMYVGTGEGTYGDGIRGLGILKSTDGGVSWTNLASTDSFYYIGSILVDNNGSLYATVEGSGVKKSIDGGSSWTTVLGGDPATYAGGSGNLKLASNGDVYACFNTYFFATGITQSNVFISDFGLNGSATGNLGTWKDITPDPNGNMGTSSDPWQRIVLACAPSNSNILYGAFAGNPSSIQSYNKGTNSWVVRAAPGNTQANPNSFTAAIAVDPNNAGVFCMGAFDGVRSLDSGKTVSGLTQWYNGQVAGLTAQQIVHPDQHAYVYAPGSSNRLMIGCDGGIYYSENANSTGNALPIFVDKNNGYNVTQFYSVDTHPTDPNYALGGTQDSGTQQFTTNGLNATTQVTGGDGGYTFIDQVNPNIQITSYIGNNFYFSTNNAASFTQPVGDNNGSFINPAAYDSKNKILYSGNTQGTYLRWKGISTPALVDTAAVKIPAFGNSNITSISLAPITNNRVFFGLNNGTVVMVDNADSATGNATGTVIYQGIANTSVSCISIDPTSEDHILVSYFNYGIVSVYETKNATAAAPLWTAVEGNLPDMPVRWCMFYPGDSGKAIIATDLGVWNTELLTGNTTVWQPSNSGLANTRVDMLKFRNADRTLVAATHGRGLFSCTLPDNGLAAITGVDSLCVGSSVKLSDPVAGGTWSSANPAIATVDASGTVTGILAGKVNIFYAAGGQYSSMSMTVNALPTATITTTGNSSIYQGEGLKLTAGGGIKYKWSTGDTTATITIYKSGSYTVTAYNLNGCSSLSSPAVVTVNPALPATNFKLAITSASCKGTADGSIIITALQSLNYTATVTGLNSNKAHSFTDSVKIAGLPAGAYSVCITIADQSDYNQCFTVVVSEPKDLSVYATTNPGNGLDLYLDGGTQYNVQLNGANYTTTNNTITLPLKEGNNDLTVTTDRLCQGTFQKLINVSGKITPYPVPFQNVLYLNLGDDNINDVSVEINDVSRGKLVYKNQLVNQSGVLALDVSKLDNGVYVVHLLLNRVEKIYKVIKK